MFVIDIIQCNLYLNRNNFIAVHLNTDASCVKCCIHVNAEFHFFCFWWSNFVFLCVVLIFVLAEELSVSFSFGRDVYEKSLRAFVSFVKAYGNHECSLIFRLKGDTYFGIEIDFLRCQVWEIRFLTFTIIMSDYDTEVSLTRSRHIHCSNKMNICPFRPRYVPTGYRICLVTSS